MANKERVFKLRCAYQTFIWGKLGESSLVAELLKNSDENLDIDPGTAYSELWMGTHCLGNACIIRSDGTEEDLDKWIERNPDSVHVQNGIKSNGTLPFMFKVLSIRKTLSLQAHPDKLLAADLHSKYPNIYKDGNHKPEMAIAITNFRALVGFKSIKTIAQHLADIDELRLIVGTDNAARLICSAKTLCEVAHQDALRSCFEETFMDESNRKLELLDQLVSKVQILLNKGNDVSMYEGRNLLKIAAEYPRDMGVAAVYFLNEVVLKPGESIFINVNEPHAYLEGDCLECLTCSHNVARFGLTHKLKDFDSLRKMLKYKSTAPETIEIKCKSYKDDGCTISQYLPSVPEFAVSRTEIPEKLKDTKLAAFRTASILLCMDGTGKISSDTLEYSISIKKGTAVFVSAGETIVIFKTCGSVVLFRAYHPLE